MRRFDIWIANLNPQKGAKIGKIKPVLVVQSDYVNEYLGSVIVIPFSSKPWSSKINHIKVQAGDFGFDRESTLLLDQICTIDKRRVIQRIGYLPDEYHESVESGLKKLLDLT
jgi:mRNA interferase MazF